MLPFLKPKKMASVIMAVRAKNGTEKSSKPADEHKPEHVELAQKLISAIHAKDAEAVASVLESLMDTEAAEQPEAVEGE